MNRLSVLWPGYYDVVILPPAPIRDHAIDLSRKLYRAGGLWRLGKRSFLPHISLYHIPVLDENIESFLDELQLAVNSAEWGSLETTGFDMPVMMLNRPEWLRNLHQKVVRRTLRFFDRTYGVEKMWNLDRFSGRRLEFAKRYLHKYGTPMAGMNFGPHITLNSFKAAEPTDLDVHVQRMKFVVNRLHVCELGQSHSCHRIIRELLPA
jgi:hypothetical protein